MAPWECHSQWRWHLRDSSRRRLPSVTYLVFHDVGADTGDARGQCCRRPCGLGCPPLVRRPSRQFLRPTFRSDSSGISAALSSVQMNGSSDRATVRRNCAAMSPGRDQRLCVLRLLVRRHSAAASPGDNTILLRPDVTTSLAVSAPAHINRLYNNSARSVHSARSGDSAVPVWYRPEARPVESRAKADERHIRRDSSRPRTLGPTQSYRRAPGRFLPRPVRRIAACCSPFHGAMAVPWSRRCVRNGAVAAPSNVAVQGQLLPFQAWRPFPGRPCRARRHRGLADNPGHTNRVWAAHSSHISRAGPDLQSRAMTQRTRRRRYRRLRRCGVTLLMPKREYRAISTEERRWTARTGISWQ